jgi:DNA gyrase/topoisomerase IV subunit A
MLMDLQAHQIVGHDMCEGDCDVLVHDIEELDNLLNREQRSAQEQEESRKNEIDAAEEDARRQELERQQKLNALEERAKSARESAAAFTGEGYADSTGDSETAQMLRKPAVSTRNIADVRKGFIWAKVLDEPRFKRRWSAQYR